MQPLNVTTEILDVEEARRRLPEVRAEVEQIMAVTERLRAIIEEHGEDPDVYPEELDAEMGVLDVRFKEALQRMNALGACLKDPETGLVDFYTWRDDDMVHLCWQHGEPTIDHWHAIDEGFEDRKPL